MPVRGQTRRIEALRLFDDNYNRPFRTDIDKGIDRTATRSIRLRPDGPGSLPLPLTPRNGA